MKTKRIIYQCAFEVQSERLTVEERQLTVFGRICEWMKAKYPSFQCGPEDLHLPLDWTNGEKHDFVARRMLVDDEDVDIFYFKLEHPDGRQSKFKNWETEIGVSVKGNCVYFSLQVATNFSEDFIGAARAEQARPPRLIKWLVSDPDLILRRGDYVVFKGPKTLSSGDYEGFFSRLDEYTNGMSKVVVKGSGAKVPLIAEDLSSSLIGVAEIFCIYGNQDEEEVIDVLADYDDTGLVVSYSHRIRRDSISVYRPGGGPGDWKHQMVYSKKLDETRVVENICISLNRSGFGWLRKTLLFHCFDLADLERLYRRQERVRLDTRMKEYQARGLDRDQKELWAELIELTNKEEKLAEVERELVSYKEDVEVLESQLESVSNNVEYEKGLRKTVEEERDRAIQRQAELMSSLIPVPRKFSEIEGYFGNLYSRMHFADGAVDTAIETRGLSEVDLVNVFHSMGQVLPKISALHGPALDEALRAATGWECTSSEGAMTKSDKRFMRMRTFSFSGKDRLCLPHLKKNSARIYFCIEEDCLYIGHAGKHLDTAATKRRSHR
ncbi:hypothetical protein N9084_01890 [Flavobacteriales bacterium]|nr:hypothetical protein [Flavobacteriales bacterium]